jgi:hypothetical protein
MKIIYNMSETMCVPLKAFGKFGTMSYMQHLNAFNNTMHLI